MFVDNTVFMKIVLFWSKHYIIFLKIFIGNEKLWKNMEINLQGIQI